MGLKNICILLPTFPPSYLFIITFKNFNFINFVSISNYITNFISKIFYFRSFLLNLTIISASDPTSQIQSSISFCPYSNVLPKNSPTPQIRLSGQASRLAKNDRTWQKYGNIRKSFISVLMNLLF
jgi:hypothetical protein